MIWALIYKCLLSDRISRWLRWKMFLILCILLECSISVWIFVILLIPYIFYILFYDRSIYINFFKFYIPYIFLIWFFDNLIYLRFINNYRNLIFWIDFSSNYWNIYLILYYLFFQEGIILSWINWYLGFASANLDIFLFFFTELLPLSVILGIVSIIHLSGSQQFTNLVAGRVCWVSGYLDLILLFLFIRAIVSYRF